MTTNREKLKQVAGWIEPYRVTDGSKFRLKKIDPADTRGLKADKKEAADRLSTGVEWLAAEQDKLYAQDRRSLLLIFQAMDAAGKDSTIKHVMTGVNPQGVQVVAFKQPSSEELDHDWMWRCYRHLPERGRIGIFNRSYYEEVLVVRVHQEILLAQKLPAECVGKNVFDQRLRGHRGDRGLPGAQRHVRAEIFSARLAQGAEKALPGAARRAVEELEVCGGRRQGAVALE